MLSKFSAIGNKIIGFSDHNSYLLCIQLFAFKLTYSKAMRIVSGFANRNSWLPEPAIGVNYSGDTFWTVVKKNYCQFHHFIVKWLNTCGFNNYASCYSILNCNRLPLQTSVNKDGNRGKRQMFVIADLFLIIPIIKLNQS